MTTLTQIREKVRKVTGSPSPYQLSDEAIDEYIDTFYLYDLPEHLRLLKLKRVYTFFTEPNIESYELPDETILTVEPPLYVGGYQARYLQDREVFYMRWPPINQFQQIGTGNGVDSVLPLSKVQSVPFIRGSLYVSAVWQGRTITFADNKKGSFDSENFAIQGITQGNPTTIVAEGHPFVAGQTVRIDGVIGMLNINGTVATVSNVMPGVSFDISVDSAAFQPYTGGGFCNSIGVGSISYTSGTLSMDFGFVPDAGTQIQAQYIFYTAGRPYDVLFYANQFHMRPVPDKAYKVEINCFVQPSSMFGDSSVQSPELREWWQLIAYGAAQKVFADRADFDSLQQFFPTFEEQKLLVQRRTLKQITNQRVSTIYQTQNLYPQSNQYPYN